MNNATTRCTYCPNTATTKDHVPPECLFAKPLPHDLITVPSCGACNHGASKDDEYFMVRLVLNQENAHADAVALRKVAIHALARLEAAGFRAEFLKTVEDEEVLTPAGVYLGNRVTYGARTDRLSRVLSRVTLGLRFHETGQRLTPEEKVGVIPLDAIQAQSTRQKVTHDARVLLRLGQRRVTARNVVTYWWAAVNPVAGNPVAGNAPLSSTWLLQFYENERLFFMTYIFTAAKVSNS